MPDSASRDRLVLSTCERGLCALEEMIDNGIAVAVPAALHHCLEWKCPVPDWLVAASIDLMSDLLKSERPKRRGRTATHIARYRQDNIDGSRWSTVVWQREAQRDLLDQVRRLPKTPNLDDDFREDRIRLQKWLGTTLSRAFECSSMILEGTQAFGSPDAIKRSYFKVLRNLKDPKQRLRYHFIDPQFLMHKLGIMWEPFVRPGRKIEPLYNLSLGRD